jgi:RNA polymerase sigma-70 factor (ECF subfamily)
MPDAELAQRVASGDHDAFRLLMRRNNQTLFRTARSILRDDAEAEDAVQEAYLQAYRSIGQFRGDAKLSTWLVRIAANEALGRLRKRQRMANVIPLDGEASEPLEREVGEAMQSPPLEPEREAMRGETRSLIEAQIDRLPDAFRVVFVLRAVEEMSVEETAQCLGIPEATVRSRFFRARSLLREGLSRQIDVATEGAFSFAGERCDRIVASVMARLGGTPA